ncbi:MAG TPA: DUF389 domain-containing protein [Longimicrobiaceae bacterium]|nr:DUF389 domain-containing protein [Longimicrobiaceae bacterium]
MQKTIQVTVPPEQTDEIVALLRKQDGLIGLQLQRGISLHPPGDTVTAVVSTPTLNRVLRLLQERRIGSGDDSSIVTSEPASVISPPVRATMSTEPSDQSWEEIETEMAKESNMTPNALLLMGIAGGIAAAGIATDTLHLVVGAMIVAPGFEPITRVSFGIVTRNTRWRHALLHAVQGYAVLVAGAVAASLLLLAFGVTVSGESTYLAAGELLSYWSSVSPAGVLVSALAGAAGAILIASGRSVLTAGVLVSLALIPSATLMGMALVGWDLSLLGRAGLRWLVDVVLVGVMAFPVFAWHSTRLDRRTSML